MKKGVVVLAVVLSGLLAGSFIPSENFGKSKLPQPLLIDSEMKNSGYEINFTNQSYEITKLDDFNFELKAGARQDRYKNFVKAKIKSANKIFDYSQKEPYENADNLPLINLDGVVNNGCARENVKVTYDLLEDENDFVAYSKNNNNFEKFTGEKTFNEPGDYIIAAHNSNGNSYRYFTIDGQRLINSPRELCYVRVTTEWSYEEPEEEIQSKWVKLVKTAHWINMPPENWRSKNVMTLGWIDGGLCRIDYDKGFEYEIKEYYNEYLYTKYLYNKKNLLTDTTVNKVKTQNYQNNDFRITKPTYTACTNCGDNSVKFLASSSLPMSMDTAIEEYNHRRVLEFTSAEYSLTRYFYISATVENVGDLFGI